MAITSFHSSRAWGALEKSLAPDFLECVGDSKRWKIRQIATSGEEILKPLWTK
jgi:hypothetical protein